MLKRFFLVFLCFILILGTVSCSSSSGSNETTPSTDIQTGTQLPTDTQSGLQTQMPTDTQPNTGSHIGTDTQISTGLPVIIETQINTQNPIIIETQPITQIPVIIETQPITENPIITETQPTTETQISIETQVNTETQDSSETQEPNIETSQPTEIQTESTTPPASNNDSYVKISGENRFKIVYAKGLSDSLGKSIRTKLKALDKDATTTTYYSVNTDDIDDDGSREILIGLTNREESIATKDTLKTYLDFTVAVLGNKIVIYANTEDRLEDAIQYFFTCLIEMDDGVYFVPTSLIYTDTYDNYTFSNFTITRKNINTFSIVIPSSATRNETELAEALQLWIAENTGVMLSIKKDNEPAAENEIIIGKANRIECSKYTTEYMSTIKHSIETNGSKLILITGATGSYDTIFSIFKEKAAELKGRINSISEIKTLSPLNNKKAIFIGNSFVYWGNCVSYIPYKDIAANVDLQTRLKGNDNGYFTQICKANEINMNVYNFTYGGQNLEWIYSNKLSKLEASFFADFDYVFISEAGQNEASFKATVKKIANLFPNAEEIVYLAHEYTFRTNSTYIINALDDLSALGMKIVSWGELVYDVHSGKVSVPGARLSYNKNSFIKNSTGAMSQDAAVISLSGNGDNFHQNPLSGYITAQMCFSVISGISAQGQKYDFCWDKSLGAQYDFDNFLKHQYNNGQTSNFVKIFNSASDMAGLQKLMDTYIAKYN